jgi:3-methyladenine DNA glycosylase AlkD
MHKNMIEVVKAEMLENADKESASVKKRYFKVLDSKDIFWGVSNPLTQSIFKKHEKSLTLSNLFTLLSDPVHEIRYGALVLLVRKYEISKNPFDRTEIVQNYLDHLKYINNWDLVDCSCYKIIGHYAFHYDKAELIENLLPSENLWEQRVAIVSCLYFIKKKSFSLGLTCVQKFINEPEDLIQKACGWMLKETWSFGGKELVEDFLSENISSLSRTCLRYAIEKMPDKQRKYFLTMK